MTFFSADACLARRIGRACRFHDTNTREAPRGFVPGRAFRRYRCRDDTRTNTYAPALDITRVTNADDGHFRSRGHILSGAFIYYRSPPRHDIAAGCSRDNRVGYFDE